MSRPTERPALKLASRLCFGPYRHLAQFVFYVLLEEDDAIPRELVALFSRVFPNPREQSAHLN
jgi:hypothetical protein